MDEGVRIAWVSLDEQDEPGVLDTYIAYACECAAAGAGAGPDGPGVADSGTAPRGIGSWTALAAHAIADLDAAFVLVFDEVETAREPAISGAARVPAPARPAEPAPRGRGPPAAPPA